jgi:hypothetical protein
MLRIVHLEVSPEKQVANLVYFTGPTPANQLSMSPFRSPLVVHYDGKLLGRSQGYYEVSAKLCCEVGEAVVGPVGKEGFGRSGGGGRQTSQTLKSTGSSLVPGLISPKVK